MAEPMEQVCVCVCARARVQGAYFESDYISAAVWSTIAMQYHHSGNFLTVHHIAREF
jgi:hypothetical protein